MPGPWWLDEAAALASPADLGAWAVGPLWNLSERLRFVRDNVEEASREAPHAEAWLAFERREAQVRSALAEAVAAEAGEIRSGARSKAAFRAHWEGLGFASLGHGGGTPADDYLDALFDTSRLVVEPAAASFATVNLGSRASRVSDFLAVTGAAAGDVVFDLGSGSGKFALTVAASAHATVRGVELLPDPVARARASAGALGLANASFDHADVRDVDLSAGSVFYLYYPFHGEVAATVAGTLGALARERDVAVYFSGPVRGFAEYFLREVDAGAFRLADRRGEFGEVLVLASDRT